MDQSQEPVGDGCTGWFDGTWRYCCDIHDGAYLEQVSKFQADWDLFICVTNHDPVAAILMFIGVTLFGWIWYRKNKKK